MSLLSDLLFFGTIVFRSLQLAAQIFVRLLLDLPLRLYASLASIVTNLAVAVLAVVQRRNLALIIVVGALAVIFLGPLARDETSTFLQLIDAVLETLRPVGELISKLVFLSLRELARFLFAAYNTVVLYLFERFSVFIDDAADLYTAIASTGDYFQVFTVPKILWTWLSSSLLYLWTTEPLTSRTTVFANFRGDGTFDNLQGFVYPFFEPRFEARKRSADAEPEPVRWFDDSDVPHRYSGAVRVGGFSGGGTSIEIGDPGAFNDGPAFEFNPMFGAFGTPSGRPPGILFYLRNVIVDAVVIAQTLGDLIFCAIEDLENPGGRFFPHFIVSVDSEVSYWRRIADVTGRVTSFVSLSSFYPAQADGRSAARYIFESYLFKTLRIVACFVRYVNLLLFDLLTSRRGLSAEQLSEQTGYVLALNKLRGVPIVDLFLDGLVFGTLTNINLLSKYHVACLAAEDVIRQATRCIALGSLNGLSPMNTMTQNAEVITLQTINCKGSFSGVLNVLPGTLLSVDCPLWAGLLPPREDERVDYVFELYRCFIDIVELVQDPIASRADSVIIRDGPIKLYQNVLQPLIRIAVQFAYYVNAETYAFDTDQSPTGCMSECAFSSLEFRTLVEISSIVEYIFSDETNPDGTLKVKSCIVEAYDEVVTVPNPIACAIAFAGQTSPTFNSLCKSVQDFAAGSSDIDFTGLLGFADGFEPYSQLRCDDMRKRSVTSEQFGAADKDASPRWRDRLFLWSAYLAGESRRAYRQSHHCFERSLTRCSLYNVTSQTIDCVAEAVDSDNMWHGLLHNSTRTRNAMLIGSMVYETLSGCQQSHMHSAYRSVTSAMQLGQTWGARFLLLWSDYLPAYFTCMQQALDAADRDADRPMADISDDYLRCLGFVVEQPHASTANATEAADSVVSSAWTDVLQRYGIQRDSSYCARMLHERQLVLEDAGSGPALSAEHAYYRLCMLSFAVGARSTLRGSSQHPLVDFTDLWRAPLALMESTKLADTRALLRGEFNALLGPPVGDSFPLLLLLQQQTNGTGASPAAGAGNRTASDGWAEYLARNYAVAESAVRLGNFLADTYDLVITQPSTADEKDAATEELLHYHIGSRKTHHHADNNNNTTAKTSVDERRELFQRTVRQQRNKLKFVDVINRFQDTVYWAGTLAVGSANATHEQPYEFAIDINERAMRRRAMPHISVRALHDRHDALYDQRYSSRSSGNWRRINMRRTRRMLEERSRRVRGKRVGGERQLVARAIAAYDALAGTLHPTTTMATAQDVSHYELVARTGAFLRALWSLVNRRLRVQSLPPYHSAALMLHLITQGDAASLSDYLDGRQSFLAGVGFVDNAVYDQFMQDEQYKRERALGAYTATMTSQEADNIVWMSRDRAMAYKLYVEQQRRWALPATAPDGQQMPRTAYKASFAKRSAFLKRHSLHGHDQYLHKVAPRSWPHWEAASRAVTYEQREFYSVQASLASGDFVGAADDLFAMLGLGENLLADVEESLGTFLVDSYGSLIDGSVFGQLEPTLAQFFVDIACDVDQDIRLGGTGSYKLGCFPLIPENLFDFIEVFTKDSEGKGILGYFEGPGYVEWPATMIRTDCPTPRVPSLQDPDLELPFWQRIQQAITLDDQGGNVPPDGTDTTVFPVNFDAPDDDDDGVDLGAVFESVTTVTDFCLVDTNRRPLCPVSDWCQRDYFSASEKGFNDGTVNLQVLTNGLRTSFVRLVRLDELEDALLARIVGFGVPFVLLGVGQFFAILPAGEIALFIIAFEVVVNQELARIVVPLLVSWALLLFVPLAAWIVVGLIQFRLLAFAIGGQVFFDGLVNLALSLFPDTLLVSIFDLLANSALLGVVVDTSFFADTAARATAAQAMFPATEENVVYSLFSFYNVASLFVSVLPILLIALAVLIVAFALISTLFLILFDIIGLYFRLRDILVRRRVGQLENDLVEVTDEYLALSQATSNELRNQEEIDSARYQQLTRNDQTLRRRITRVETDVADNV